MSKLLRLLRFWNNAGENDNQQHYVPLETDLEVPSLPAKHLKAITNDFGEKALIGKGSRGEVYYAKLENGKEVAVKKLYNSNDPEFLNQVSIIFRLKHENVVELVNYCDDSNLHMLVYEFATVGSLHDILHGRNGVKGAQPGPVLDWMKRIKVAFDAAQGLEYLHKQEPPLIHRYITSSNILLFEDYKAKIADFIVSNHSPDMDYLHGLSNMGCLAPETAMGVIRRTTDVYSFGIVLLELLTGRKALDRPEVPNLVKWGVPILREGKLKQCVDPKLNNDYPPEVVKMFANLAVQCVEYTPRSRPDMRTVVLTLERVLSIS